MANWKFRPLKLAKNKNKNKCYSDYVGINIPCFRRSSLTVYIRHSYRYGRGRKGRGEAKKAFLPFFFSLQFVPHYVIPIDPALPSRSLILTESIL